MLNSDVISNLICVICDEKLRDTRKFRDSLIENENRLSALIPHEITFVDPEAAEDAKSPLFISKVHVATEIMEEEEDEDSDEMEETVFKVMKQDFHMVSEMIEISSEDSSRWTSDDEDPTPKKSKEKIRVSKDMQTVFNLNIFCKECSRFMSKNEYRAHLEQHHLNLKIYACDFCGLELFSHLTLQKHMVLHMKEKPFKCTLGCETSCWTLKALADHNAYAHSDECICDTCGKKFKTKAIMKVRKIDGFYSPWKLQLD